MQGDPTDNNAKLFAQGYDGVLAPHFSDKSYVKVGEPAGTWDAPTAATNFEQQFTAHPNTNAVVMPNDNTANAVVSVLQKDKIPPKTFPTTGQDASPSGLQNILKGYQCGTVYKPVYEEAQAAVAIALYLRAGLKPPSTLVNAQTMDSTIGKNIASVYTVPTWVTSANMASTVIKDKAVPVSQICVGAPAEGVPVGGHQLTSGLAPGCPRRRPGAAAGEARHERDHDRPGGKRRTPRLCCACGASRRTSAPSRR